MEDGGWKNWRRDVTAIRPPGGGNGNRSPDQLAPTAAEVEQASRNVYRHGGSREASRITARRILSDFIAGRTPTEASHSIPYREHIIAQQRAAFVRGILASNGESWSKAEALGAAVLAYPDPSTLSTGSLPSASEAPAVPNPAPEEVKL